MSNKPSSVDIAETISELMYGIAGWLLIGLGTFALFGGINGIIQTAGTAEVVMPFLLLGFAFLFITSGIFVNPRFRRRLDRRREVSRFGRARTVDSRVLSADENRRESCISCGCKLTEGLVRRYQKELLVAGVPVWTGSESRNFYCPACAIEEMSTPDVSGSNRRDSTDRAVDKNK